MYSQCLVSWFSGQISVILNFLPRSWIFFICCQDLGFLRFLAKILAINLAKKSKKNQDLAKKSKIMPVETKDENHSCFNNYKLGYKYFSSYVKLRLIL